jgi:hypothetical protein
MEDALIDTITTSMFSFWYEKVSNEDKPLQIGIPEKDVKITKMSPTVLEF